MEYFKKCPQCGQYMYPYLRFNHGHTVWFCDCGYFRKNIGIESYSVKTTYKGGGSSDRTVDRNISMRFM